MLDVYFGNMDGVEVHAETPEEEQEAAFILNSALSGKTTFLGGCLCPSEADSTVSKGFRLMLSEGTDLYVTPALDVDGTPALEICCTTANEEQQEADEPAYTMELGIEPAKEHYTLRDYIAVMYQFIWNLTDNELMLMGHNKKEGKNRLGLGIEMIDMLADYSEEAADTEVFLVPGINDDGEAVLLIRCRSCDEEMPLCENEFLDEEPERSRVPAYTRIVKGYIEQMGQEELEAIGLDEDSGRDHLLAALDTIDRLSTYNDEEAWDSYCDFMGRNFSGIWFCPHEDLDLEEMDDKDKLEWVYESDDMEDEWPF